MSAVAFPFERDVVAAQRGDRDAFTRLIDAHSNVVCAITLAIVRDVTSSEDVAQNVLVAAWRSIGTLRSPASFLPWLRQLARNQANEFVRTRSRYSRHHIALPESDAVRVADAAATASERLIDDEERLALADAIEELPDDAREVVTLYYREGRSTRQVAELLGLREDAVKKRLERARTSLKSTVLERFATTVRQTGPGVGFTAAVVAAMTVTAPSTATAATAGAKSVVNRGALGKLAALVSLRFASVLCVIAATIGLFAWVVVEHPMAANELRTASLPHDGGRARESLSSATSDGARYPHATKDREKRDEIRRRILEALVDAESQVSSEAQTSNGQPSPPRGQRQANDIDEFGRFVAQAIREDFVPMARECARELTLRKPGAGGTALVAFELLGDTSIGGVVNSAEIVKEESTIGDSEFETCIRESLYGVYFDPPPASTRVTLRFPVKVVDNRDGAIDDQVEDFHLRDRR